MMILYYVALAIGGTLLLASLFLGGDHDHDADLAHGDFDGGVDADFDADGDFDMDAADAEAGAHTEGIDAGDVLAWLPVTSLRFWTFFLAFFGVTGAVLDGFDMLAWPFAAATAGAVGYASGMAMVTAVRRLRKDQTDSSVRADDYIGETATVMVAVAKDKPGKVRVRLKGRTIELLAETEDDTGFAVKDQAMVYRMTDEGSAIITRRGELSS